MITKINKIDIKEDLETGETYLVIYFFDEILNYDAFSYLSQKSLNYWKNFRKVKELKVGMPMNVFKLGDSKYYKIISIDNK